MGAGQPPSLANQCASRVRERQLSGAVFRALPPTGVQSDGYGETPARPYRRRDLRAVPISLALGMFVALLRDIDRA